MRDELHEDFQNAHVFCPRRGLLLAGQMQSESAVGVRLIYWPYRAHCETHRSEAVTVTQSARGYSERWQPRIDSGGIGPGCLSCVSFLGQGSGEGPSGEEESPAGSETLWQRPKIS